MHYTVPWLTEEVIAQCAKETTGRCEICKGTGLRIEHNVLKDCDCIALFLQLTQLSGAAVPRRYWAFDFRLLTKPFKEENGPALKVLYSYIENIHANVQSGASLFLQGESGLAKTATASYILRVALTAGYKGYMVRLSRLSEIPFLAFNQPQYRELWHFLRYEVQIVVVEEIDKDFGIKDPSNPAGAKMAEVFGCWYDRKIPMIMTSNTPRRDMGKIHSSSVVDRISEAVDVFFVGTSFRLSERADIEQKILQQIKRG